MQKNTKLREKQINGAQAEPKIVEVTFALENAQAKEVYLCGDFNGWSPTSVRMIRQEGNGRWQKRLTLPPGRYEYKFVVDGEWVADPGAHRNVANTLGSINSVVEVQV